LTWLLTPLLLLLALVPALLLRLTWLLSPLLLLLALVPALLLRLTWLLTPLLLRLTWLLTPLLLLRLTCLLTPLLLRLTWLLTPLLLLRLTWLLTPLLLLRLTWLLSPLLLTLGLSPRFVGLVAGSPLRRRRTRRHTSHALSVWLRRWVMTRLRRARLRHVRRGVAEDRFLWTLGSLGIR